MADTLTAIYGWVKPEVGGSNDTWGAKENTTIDAIEGIVSKQYANRKNRFVNAAMQINQENLGVTSGSTGFYPADEWRVGKAGTAVVVAGQTIAATPKGSQNRIDFNVTTAEAVVDAADFHYLRQRIEGHRIADAQFGTANAKQLIVRFGINGPAGTYGFSLVNNDENRSYLADVVISGGEALTDVYKTVIIPGDTVGNWYKTMDTGGTFGVATMAGATSKGVAGWQAGNLIGTAAMTNNLGILGHISMFDFECYVDHEALGVAPKWDLPDYSEELRKCQRYFWKATQNIAEAPAGVARFSMYSDGGLTLVYGQIKLPETMRVTPVATVLTWIGGFNNSARGATFSPDMVSVFADPTVGGEVSLILQSLSVSARL